MNSGKQRCLTAVFLFAGIAFSTTLFAQAPSKKMIADSMKDYDTVVAKVEQAQLKKLMSDLKKKGASVSTYNAKLVASDILAHKDYSLKNAPFAYYTVPAFSNIPRVADTYPVDGTLAGALEMVAAKDEYESVSFVVYPFADVAKFELKASDLKSAEGKVIPADRLDLKLVKVWYQNNNAWYNYFGDFTKKLVPELLLNDENLVKVDTETEDNYLRVDYPSGSRYIWISAPDQIDPGFDTNTEPVYDAPKLLPVTLSAGEFKQFWITADIAKGTSEGLYKGSVMLTADGKNIAEIPIRLRVLPFILPDPKTNYDLNADFYTLLYCVPGAEQYYPRNGYDQQLSDKKALNRFMNQKKHNITSPLFLGLWRGYDGIDQVRNSVGLAKKAGMRMDPFFEAFYCGVDANDPQAFLAFKRNLAIAKKEFKEMLGHTNLYPAGGEEPGYNHFMRVRESWKHVQEEGMRVLCNGHDRRYFAGYNDDLLVKGGFADQEIARFMHDVKGKIGNYAGPHTGPENPDYMRRMHGMNLYKKDYDMSYNYGYHEGGWNDFRLFVYRNMNLIYYTRDNIIDTLAWEGIREGIDDIRYATYLKQIAEKALAQGGIERSYAARKGLQCIALIKEEEVDLNALRLEMIEHILKITALLK